MKTVAPSKNSQDIRSGFMRRRFWIKGMLGKLPSQVVLNTLDPSQRCKQAHARESRMRPVKSVKSAFVLAVVAGLPILTHSKADCNAEHSPARPQQYFLAAQEWSKAANLNSSEDISASVKTGMHERANAVKARKQPDLTAGSGNLDALELRHASDAAAAGATSAKAQQQIKFWPKSYAQNNFDLALDGTRNGLSAGQGGSPPREIVFEVQKILTRLGYRPGPIDGIWGQATESAFRSLLNDTGLQSRQKLTKTTLDIIRKLADSHGAKAVSENTADQSPQSNGDASPTASHSAAEPDTDRGDSRGWTPLMHASADGDIEAVQSLIAQGANVDGVGPDGLTSLYLAVLYEHPQIVELLFSKGASISAKDSEGRTVSDAARLIFGNPEVAIANGMGKKIAGLAAGLNWQETMAWFAELDKFSSWLGRSPFAKEIDENGWTDLHWAAVLNLPMVAVVLLESGVDQDTMMKFDSRHFKGSLKGDLKRVRPEYRWDELKRDGDTPLRVAAMVNSTDIINVLIDRGADVNELNKYNSTPLHRAAWHGSMDAARALIGHGAEVNPLNRYGASPLHWAIWHDEHEVAELLLKHGADADAANQQGDTPLHYAALRNAIKSAKVLIEHGARVAKTNENGFYPTNIATMNGHYEMLHFLREKRQ